MSAKEKRTRTMLRAAIAFLCLVAHSSYVSSSALLPLVKNPAVYSLDARIMVSELKLRLGTQATINDVADEDLDDYAEAGFDAVCLMGVWQPSKFSLQKSMKGLSGGSEGAGGSAQAAAAASSPYAIVDYSVNNEFGGNLALAKLRSRLHERGLRLFLDFVPNHMAVDHPWTITRPELLIQGKPEDLEKEPQNFFRVGSNVFAHGRDPYFDGWEDTVQLNYANPDLRAEMCTILTKIVSICDGVRCDMAMLLCPDILEQTWGKHLGTAGAFKEPFWPDAIKVARAIHDDFILMGEVFWGRDLDLQQFGFDFTFDKNLYDKCVEGNAIAIRQHLGSAVPSQDRMVRYLENHDEKRIAQVVAEVDKHTACAVLSYTLPGMRFFHDGQLQGRKIQIDLTSLHRERGERRDSAISSLYCKLLGNILTRPELREGRWAQCKTGPAMDGNPSWQHIIAHCAWDTQGNCMLVVINFSGEYASGHVVVPESITCSKRCGLLPSTMNFADPPRPRAFKLDKNDGQMVVLRDILFDDLYERESAVLLGKHGGVWFSLKPWQAHVFELSIL